MPEPKTKCSQPKVRACVIGWPIEHSRSPIIHGYWLEKYSIPGSYEKIAVTPQDAPAFLRGLGEVGLAGCNVTVPLKEVAFQSADRRDASAVAVGAANTIWLEGGKVCAANTDTYGFMTNLDCQAPDWRRSGRPVTLLGAGGAARAICHGFLEAGADDIVIANRTRARAESLAADLGGGGKVRVIDWEDRRKSPSWSSVVVNTTTIGMKDSGNLEIDFAGADPRCVVADIVYVPLETGLLAAARKAGLATVDGLGMLLHQAVPGFERWFGVRPDVTDDLRALVLADIGD